MAFSVGSAYVSVLPSMRGFQTQVKTEVAKIRDVKIKVTPEIDSIKAAASAKAAAASMSQTVKFDVELDDSGARAGLRELANSSKRLNGSRTRVSVKADGLGQSIIGFAALARAMRTLALPAAIVAATPYLLSLASSAVTASQSLLLLPAAMVAGAVAAGTLMLGLRGIGDAMKELTKQDDAAASTAAATGKARQAALRGVRTAQQSLADAVRAADRAAVQGAEQVADARRALADAISGAAAQVKAAEDDLTRAQQRQRQAQEDLTRARRDAREELQQLQFSVEGAALSEEEAADRLEGARARLAEAKASGAGAEEIDDLDRAVRQADLALRESADRYRDLKAEGAEWARTGIEGSRGVVDAQRGVTEANRGVADAEAAVAQARIDGDRQVADARRDLGRTIVSVGQQQADAARAVQQATEALAEAQAAVGEAGASASDKAAQAMGKLSGNARALVGALRTLGPAWKSMQLGVQDRLLAGISGRILALGRNYIPILGVALGAMADGFNRAGAATMDWLNTQPAMATVRFTLDNIALGLSNAAGAIQPLVQAFWDLAAVGSTFFPQFGSSIANAAARFRDFIAAARQSGDLKIWMQQGIDTMRQLWQLTKNLGSVFGGLFRAADASGESFLSMLVRVTGGMAAALKTPEGAGAVTSFFTHIRTLVSGFVDKLRILWPVLTAAGSAFMALFVAASPFANTLLQMVSVVLPPFFNFIGMLAPILGPVLVAVGAITLATKAWSIAMLLLNAAMSANPIAKVIVIITALVAGVIYAWKNFEWFRNIVLGVWTAIQVAARWMWNNVLRPVLNAIGLGWRMLITSVKWYWDNILKPTWGALQVAARWMWVNVLRPIFGAIGAGWSLLGDGVMWVYRNIIQPAWNAMQRGLSTLKGWFDNIVAGIGRVWDGLRAMLAKPVNFLINQIWNRGFINAWNKVSGWIPGLKPIGKLEPVAFAKGGFHEDHTAQIAKGGAVRMWAEPETGGEAYIPLAKSKRQRSAGILSQVADRFGLGVVPQGDVSMFADGGLWRRMAGVIQNAIPGTRVTSGYRPGDPGYHGSGRAVDLAGPGSMNMGHMLRVNRHLANNFANSTQLIHTQPGAVNLFRGRPHTYNAGTRADHRDHVHWALENAAMLKGAQGNYTGDGGGSWFNPIPGWIRALINRVVTPLINRLPGAPPEFNAIPKNIATMFKDKALDFLLGQAGPETGPGTPGTGPVQDQVRNVSAKFGWGGGAQWAALHRLIQKESSWNPNAQNPVSTAYGLYQFLNSTWATVGGRKTSNPGLQAEYGNRYIRQRYGNPASALNFHNRNNWYDNGGVAFGKGMMAKDTITPERVLSGSNTKSFDNLVGMIASGRLAVSPAGASGGGESSVIGSYHTHLHGDNNEVRAVQELEHRLRIAQRGGSRR